MNQPLTVTEHIGNILQEWITVAGIDTDVLNPERSSWSYSLGGRSLVGTGNQRDHLKMLEKAWELDPTGVSLLMLIRGFFEEWLQDRTFNALDLILHRDRIEATLKPMEALRDLLEGEESLEIILPFEQALRDALTYYGIEVGENINRYIADKLLLAEIRRDALLAVGELECHQFVKGDGQDRPIGFNPHVWEFWNINSLIAAMRGQMQPGVTLCLIRDPEALNSFFVFAIKNGDNLLILTDRAKVPHPDFKRMSRSYAKAQTRDFLQRANRFWLPYDLLDLEVTEDQKALRAKARSALVPKNAEGVKLAAIKDLHPTQLLWLVMMFDRINDAFWREGRVAPQLSYTGEMVAEPHALVGANGSLVREGHYKPLQLAPLDREEMKDAHKDDQWARKPTGWNRWMIVRYEDQVPDHAFSVVGGSSLPALRDSLREEGLIAPKIHRTGWEADPSSSFFKPDRHGLRALDPTTFGTAKSLDRDRRWAARVNQCRVIQHLAVQEYQRERERVWKWYLNEVRSRKEALLDRMVTEEWTLPTFCHRYDCEREDHPNNLHRNPFINYGPDGWRDRVRDRNAIQTGLNPNLTFGKYGEGPWFKGVPFSPYPKSYSDGWRCVDRGVKASVFYRITVNCPEGLAALLGVEIGDLPWPLQETYWGEEPYHGNSILDRCDPEDFTLENPWIKGFNLNISAGFSKNAANARRKKQGLPRKKWI